MKRNVIGLLVLSTLALPVVADETADALAVAQKATNCLAVVAVTVDSEVGGRTFGGQALCIDAKQGLFMSMSLPVSLKSDDIKECTLILPAQNNRKVKARFVGIDAVTQLGFIQATEAHGATAIQFSKSSNLKPGQQVVSAGIMTSLAGFPSYLGVAYVSTEMRMPDRLVMVTGGTLTNSCSPVLNAQGKAVGLVGRQLPVSYQTNTQRGTVRLSLSGVDKTQYFWPIEEFASVVTNPPTGGKATRPSWIGVGQFSPVAEAMAEVLGIENPDQSVKVESVVPGHIGAEAGLKTGDVIIKVNGNPLEPLANAALTRQNFIRQITRLPSGTTVNLVIMRDRKPVDISVKTEPLPTTQAEAKQYASRAVGMAIRERVPLETDMDPTAVAGLVVRGVGQKSDAAQAGLRPGDVITAINGTPVTTIAAFQPLFEAALKAALENKGQWPMLKISRGEGSLDIQVRITRRN